MIKHFTGVVLLLGSVVAAGAATPQCLKPAEIEAEQAIRFQAELMVISDTCGQQTYIRFAKRNRDVLVEYQHEMIEHFRRNGTARAEARFDTYLTRLANEVSLRAGARPVASVCQDAAEFLATADTLGKDEFRRYIADRAAEHRVADRRCTSTSDNN